MLGFFGGAAKGAQGELEDQDKRAFALKLQNAQIEGQIEKEKQLFDYQRVNEPTASALNEALGIRGGEARPAMSQSGATGLLAGLQRASMRTKAGPSGLRAQVIGDGPDQKIVWFDKNDPGKISGELKVGQNPSAYKAYAKTASEYAPVKITVDNINSSIDALLNDENLIQRAKTTGELKLGALVKEGDPRVIDLINNRKGYALQIAAVVNRGRPSDPDAKAIESMLPNEYDSTTYAKKKMERIDAMLSATEESDYKLLMAGELPQFRKDKNAASAGGHTAEDFVAEDARRAALRKSKQAEKDALKPEQAR